MEEQTGNIQQEEKNIISETENNTQDKPKGIRKRGEKPTESINGYAEVPQITFTKLDHDISEEEEEEIHPEEEHYDSLTREQLVEMLEEIISQEDFNSIKNKAARIKVNFWKITTEEHQKHFEEFLAGGGKKEDYSPEEDKLEERYNAAFGKYKEKRNKFNEDLERQKQANLSGKLQILEELKALINSEETLKKTYDDFKHMQERWNAIGQVPRNELTGLWQNYHFLVDKFFDKVKINKELKDLDLKKNMESQIALCERAEDLLLETSILKSFKQLQKYHEEWKQIGPVPTEKKIELWERFKNATDRINQRRREYYDQLHEEQNKNLLAKTALCEKAEQINTETYSTPEEWKKASDGIYELQKIWKTIGYAPKKDNDSIWQRFRGALDTFHINKNDFFNKIKEEQTNNYNLKLNIVARAEALQESDDWKKTTGELIHLQNEWKNIGSVPNKYSNKIWKRFRAACDMFFNRKSEYFSNIDKTYEENLNSKLELIKKVEEFEPGDDNTYNLNQIKEFQNQWVNIGHVPAENKEKLYNDFRNAINKHFKKLNADSSHKIDLRYKSRFDSMQNSPDAEYIITKELSSVNVKVNGLKNDLKLWENNIGFLANSKNADILKADFQKKIDSAKQHLEELIEKQKYLLSLRKNMGKDNKPESGRRKRN